MPVFILLGILVCIVLSICIGEALRENRENKYKKENKDVEDGKELGNRRKSLVDRIFDFLSK